MNSDRVVKTFIAIIVFLLILLNFPLPPALIDINKFSKAKLTNIEININDYRGKIVPKWNNNPTYYQQEPLNFLWQYSPDSIMSISHNSQSIWCNTLETDPIINSMLILYKHKIDIGNEIQLKLGYISKIWGIKNIEIKGKKIKILLKESKEIIF